MTKGPDYNQQTLVRQLLPLAVVPDSYLDQQRVAPHSNRDVVRKPPISLHYLLPASLGHQPSLLDAFYLSELQQELLEF